MTTQQIKTLVSDIDRFEISIRDRANELLKLNNVPARYDKVIWSACDKDTICIRVSDMWDEWNQYFPTEYFGDDFDIEKYRKETEASIEATNRKLKEQEEQKERDLFEKLKAKFEG